MDDPLPDDRLPDDRLLLIAQDADEVPLLSALCVGAAVPVVDVGYDRKARRLALILRRYRWEVAAPSRVLSALRIESVVAVRRRKWPPEPAVLELLAFSFDGTAVTLDFAGGAALLVTVECVDLLLEDLGSPWTARTPEHE
jgi:hypothetical protein